MSKATLEALRAIAEGYQVHGAHDRYIIVANPRFTEGGDHDPYLVIDVDELARSGASS